MILVASKSIKPLPLVLATLTILAMYECAVGVKGKAGDGDELQLPSTRTSRRWPKLAASQLCSAGSMHWLDSDST